MARPELPLAFSDAVQQILTDLGLVGLALLMAAENVIPPIPSEVVLPFAGWLAAKGELSVVGALVAATAGSLAGSLILYEAARRGGRPLVLRHGRLLRVGPRDLDRAEAWFIRRGPWIVVLGRCVPGVRSLVSLPAGLLRMNRLQFVALTLAGTLVWNVALLGAGWLLGAQWSRASGVIEAAGTPLLAACVLLAAGATAWWWRRTARVGAS